LPMNRDYDFIIPIYSEAVVEMGNLEWRNFSDVGRNREGLDA